MSVSYQPLNGLIAAQGNVNINEPKHKSGSQFKQMTGIGELDQDNTTETESFETKDNLVLQQYAEINPLVPVMTTTQNDLNDDVKSFLDNTEDLSFIEQRMSYITDVALDKSPEALSVDKPDFTIQTDDADLQEDLQNSGFVPSAENTLNNELADSKKDLNQKVVDQINQNNQQNVSNDKLHFLKLLGGKYQHVLTSQNQGGFESIDTIPTINNLLPANDKFALEIMNMSQGKGHDSDLSRENVINDKFKKSQDLDTKSFGSLASLLQSQQETDGTGDTDLNYGLSIDSPFSERESWNNQLHQNILWMSSQKIHSASISMNPEELGPVDVNIQFKNDALSIVFNSKHHEVRQAIEHALPELRQLFADQTIQINSIDITDMHQNPEHGSGYYGEQAQHDQSQGESFSQLVDGTMGVDKTDEIQDQVITRRTMTSLVDYFA